MSPVRRGVQLLPLFGVLALPAAARAAYPGANGPVAFVSGQHIWVESGGALKDLTPSGSLDTQPKFSPDGRRIAFVSGGNGLPNGEILAMNADGSGRTALTKTPTGNSDPTWSPDGTRIAFISLRDREIPEIYVMNADGTGAKEVTHDTTGKSELAWSPKGDRILFVHEPAGGGDKDIYAIKPDGTGAVDLTNDPANPEVDPAWSPDGGRIAYSGPQHPTGSVGGDLWTMNADGSNKQPLQHESNGYSDGGFPAWSPDGTTIAFAANNGSGFFHAWQVPAGGGQNTDLIADRSTPGYQQLDWGPQPQGPPPPVASQSGTGSTVSGTVRFKVRGGQFVQLSGSQTIPVGSLIDARHGTVSLTVVGPTGRPQTGQFGGGLFLFTQKLERSGHKRLLTTELGLRGGSFSACGGTRAVVASAPDADAARRRVVRYLSAKAHGRFRVIGKYSSGLERGTQWKTTDTCTGTLTSVQQGTVFVTDFARHRTVRVRAHHSYLARPRSHRKRRRR